MLTMYNLFPLIIQNLLTDNYKDFVKQKPIYNLLFLWGKNMMLTPGYCRPKFLINV